MANFPKGIDFFKKIAYNDIVSTEKNVVSLIDVLKYASLLFLEEAFNGFFFYFRKKTEGVIFDLSDFFMSLRYIYLNKLAVAIRPDRLYNVGVG